MLSIWMQNMGAALFAVKRCSPMRVRMPAQDSRSAYALLYLPAVRDDWHKQEHCQDHVDIDPASLTAPEAVSRAVAWLRLRPGSTALGPHLVHGHQ